MIGIKNLKDRILCQSAVDFLLFIRDNEPFRYEFIKYHRDTFCGKDFHAIFHLWDYKEEYKNKNRQHYIFDLAWMFEGIEENDNREIFTEIALEIFKHFQPEQKDGWFIIYDAKTLDLLTEIYDVPEFENEKTRRELIKKLADEIRKIKPDFKFTLDWNGHFMHHQKLEETGYYG